EDGIRDFHVTGVQTCALPISTSLLFSPSSQASPLSLTPSPQYAFLQSVRHASGSRSLLFGPSSHSSPKRSSVTPSPQVGRVQKRRQALGSSLLLSVPLSHCSPASSTPSPQ